MTADTPYIAPRLLEDAARALAEADVAPLAGGTDLYPRWNKGMRTRPRVTIDLKHIDELRGVSRSGGGIRIGACTLVADIAGDPLVRESAPLLAEAAGCIACPQIRNRATIGGNLCNASPAADTAVPLIVLDAVVELASFGPGGLTRRELPIVEFFKGPGSTALAAGEILTHVRFETPPKGTLATWKKFGTRPAMEIAVASVGLRLRVIDGKVNDARIAFGSVAPVPLRGAKAEAKLVGRPLTAETIEACVAAAREEISPISDMRAGAEYRREIVGVMLARMLEDAAEG